MAAVSLCIFAGCATPQLPISEAEQQIRRVDHFIAALEKSYVSKDLDAVLAQFSPQYRQEHPAFFRAMGETFQQDDPLFLDLSVDMIHTHRDSIKVLLHWDGRVTHSVMQGGHATLRLHQKGDLQILSIQGDPPFPLRPVNADEPPEG